MLYNTWYIPTTYIILYIHVSITSIIYLWTIVTTYFVFVYKYLPRIILISFIIFQELSSGYKCNH